MFKNITWQTQKLPPNWLWFVGFGISIVSLIIFGFNPKNYLFKYWHYLFTYNTIVIIIAIYYLTNFVIIINKQKKHNIAGSGFTFTLAKIIPILTITPVLYFYIFSFQSVQNNLQLASNSIDKLNTTVYSRVSSIHQNLQLFKEQTYINVNSRVLQTIYQFIENTDKYPKNIANILTKLAITNNICGLSLFVDEKNIANSITMQNCEIWSDYKLSNKLYLVEEKQDKNSIHTQLPLKSIINTKKDIILVAFYKKNQQLSDIIDRANNFKKDIKNASIILNTSIIKRQFLLDFSTTILLTLVSILMIVFKMVEKMMIPLNNLSIASKKISAGEYGALAINTSADRDIKNLIAEFNQMSMQIKQTRLEVADKNLYLETVIKYSSGIIAMNKECYIHLINDQAIQLLGLNPTEKFIGKNYYSLKDNNPQLLEFCNLNSMNFANSLNTTITINHKLLDCHSATLKNDDKIIGYMLIIKDISDIIKTQKLVAWNEVARKMAHEIKNPLNPILLSAQRLRNKFLDDTVMDANHIINKTTTTIINQVSSINDMVSAFAEYGTQPKQIYKKQSLNAIIKNTISLYEEEHNIQTQLGKLNNLKLDKNSITRVLINLIKNSIEASRPDEPLKILITTSLQAEKVVLSVIDNGIGFDKEIVDKIFDPYVTNKNTSGLGMAIVEKIIIQHNGIIAIDKTYTTGAKIVITFNIES